MEKLSRNQKMLTEFEAGETVADLAARYKITRSRVCVVLQDERNKRLVSPLSFYRKLRDAERNRAVSISL